MNTENLIERFIIDELLLGVGPSSIAPDLHLIENRILDSLALMRLIVFIEERFKVKIEDGELLPDNFQTINHIKSLIIKKQPVN